MYAQRIHINKMEVKLCCTGRTPVITMPGRRVENEF